MTLTPLDIHNKEFTRGFRGYSEAEVDEFLDEVVKEFEALIRENGELKDRLDNMEQALERYRTIEDSLNKTLLLAQQAAEEVRTAGEREAEVVRERALMEAQRILDQARGRAKQAVDDYTDMRREAELFRLRMKTMLQAQLEIFGEAEAREAEVGDTPFVTGPKVKGINTRYGQAENEEDDGSLIRGGRAGGQIQDRSEDRSDEYSGAPPEEAAALDHREGGAAVTRPNLWGEPVSAGRVSSGRRASRPWGSGPASGDSEDGDDDKDY